MYAFLTWLFFRKKVKKCARLHFSNILYFGQKEPIKEQTFKTLKCLGQNSSILKRQVNSSLNFSSFFSVIIYKAFQCSDPNSPNFSNNKLVFLKILHHFSVSWDRTPLYLLAKIVYTLDNRSRSKYKFVEISPEQSKIWNFAYWWASFVQII